MLTKGAMLREYEILSVLGQGGFGIVYKGRHRDLEMEVAIKEYFPQEISVRQEGRVCPTTSVLAPTFEDGMERFLQEAKQLIRFVEQPNIVTCRGFFRANGTAYTVMDYVSGLPLSGLLAKREARGEPLSEEEMLEIMLPLLQGLRKVHEAEVCHRDIKPSNILIRHPDGVPVLIDFGAAKHEMSERTKSAAPYTDGYAAWEQVGEGEIGTWTDMYGVGAVMWRIVAGGNPPFMPPNPPSTQKRAFESMNGNPDPLPSAQEIGAGRFSQEILDAIDSCLVIGVKGRVQDCRRLLEKVSGTETEAREEVKPNHTSERKWHPRLIQAARVLARNCPHLTVSPQWLGNHLDISESEDVLDQLAEAGIVRKTQDGSYDILISDYREMDRMILAGWPNKIIDVQEENQERVKSTQTERIIVWIIFLSLGLLLLHIANLL